MQDVLRHPKWRDVIAQKADVLAHGHFDCMPVRRIGIYTVDRSAPSAAGGLYFGRDRSDLWSGVNFQKYCFTCLQKRIGIFFMELPLPRLYLTLFLCVYSAALKSGSSIFLVIWYSNGYVGFDVIFCCPYVA